MRSRLAAWRQRQQRKQAADQQRRNAIAREILGASELNGDSFSTATAYPATSVFIGTSIFPQTFYTIDEVGVPAPVLGDAPQPRRKSKQSTLEPLLVDPPPLRPTRQFE